MKLDVELLTTEEGIRAGLEGRTSGETAQNVEEKREAEGTE
jgi:hypothetical protein